MSSTYRSGNSVRTASLDEDGILTVHDGPTVVWVGKYDGNESIYDVVEMIERKCGDADSK
jgi:hypothetical protein